MNKIEALKAWFGTDVPEHSSGLCTANASKRKARQQKDERPGEEDQRRRATQQRASRLPWDLSFRLVQGKAVPAPGAQVAVRSHLRWQSSSTKVECFSFPFSSHRFIIPSGARLVLYCEGRLLHCTVCRTAFRDQLQREAPLLLR